MKAAGVGLLFVGYTLVWWGWMRLGGPVSMLDLIVPGRDPGPRGTHSGHVRYDPTIGPPSDPRGGGGGATGGGGGGGGGGGTGGW